VLKEAAANAAANATGILPSGGAIPMGVALSEEQEMKESIDTIQNTGSQ